jgi:hypothetical protein
MHQEDQIQTSVEGVVSHASDQSVMCKATNSVPKGTSFLTLTRLTEGIIGLCNKGQPRFAIGYISSSGEGGAKLNRRNWGEVVENVASVHEYHWMAGNFLKYAGPLQWSDLPVDSHELIALSAPRPLFIGGGATNGDGWADAKGMFMAAVTASPVYRLLGKRGLDTTVFPPIETPLIDGDLAFRQHAGGHTPAPNWPVFITFASRYLTGITPNPSHAGADAISNQATMKTPKDP